MTDRTINKIFKKVLANIFYYSGITRLLFLFLRRKKIILMYHHISITDNIFSDGDISKDVFEKQIRFFKRNFNIVELEDLIANLKNTKRNFRPQLAITFDDGYKDFLTEALPILKKYNVPAIVFLTTDCIDGEDILWSEKINCLIANTKQKEFTLNINDQSVFFNLVSQEDKRKSLIQLKNILKKLTNEKKEAILQYLPEVLNVDYSSLKVNDYMLNWEDVKFLKQNGISFGAHTLDHPILTQVSLDEARRQIIESKKKIESIICEPVKTFCYPNGKVQDFNDEIGKMVKESGFIGACTAMYGINNHKTNPYTLLRMPAYEKNIAKFALQFLDFTEFNIRNLLISLKSKILEAIKDNFQSKRIVMLERYLPFESDEISNRLTNEEKIKNIIVREINDSDISKLCKLRPYLTEENIRKRIDKKDRGYIAEYRSNIIAFSWISYTDNYDYYLRENIEVKEKEALSYNSFAIKDHRGRGALYWILKNKLETLSNEGIKRVFAVCIIDNIAPIKGLRRLGFLPCEIRTYLRFFCFEKRFVRKISNPNKVNLGKATKFLRLPSVIVLGMNYTSLGIIRSLSKYKIGIIALDSKDNENRFYSRFAKRYICPEPDGNQENLIGFLISLSKKSKYEKFILIPTNDIFVKFLSENREKLSKYFKFILPKKDIVNALLDKEQFAPLCEGHNIPHPRTYFLNNGSNIEEISNLVRYPVIIKPANSYKFRKQINEKGFKVNSKDELIKSYEFITNNYKDRIMIQEFIDGDDSQNYSCAVYFDKNSEAIATFTARKLRQYPIELGVGSLVESIEVPEIKELTKLFLSKIHYKGIAEVEFKKDNLTGEFKIVEVNPRSWIQNSLASCCGIDFSYLLYTDLAGIKRPQINRQKQGVKWYAFEWDLKSFLMYRRQRGLSFWQWFISLKGKKVFAHFSWDDPGPFIFTVLRFIFLNLRKLFRLNMRNINKQILTTYPISQNQDWQRQTELIQPKPYWFNPLKIFIIKDIFLPFRLLFIRKKYRVIITGAEREDMLFALLQTFLVFGKISHIMMCCLWKRERNIFRKIFKKLLFKMVSFSVTYFVTWSSDEAVKYPKEFCLPKEKFIFLPHHCSLNGHEFEIKEGDYIFSGGNSSRDYRTLIEAIRLINIKTVIALTDYKLLKGINLPDNVKIISPDPVEFRKLMSGAKMVVVPIKADTLQSAGQQTYLNAMIMRKPVIVSDATGVRDYIEDNLTGIIVPPTDITALRNAINNVLLDGIYTKQIIENAYIKVSKEFTLEKFVERNLSLAKKLISYDS